MTKTKAVSSKPGRFRKLAVHPIDRPHNVMSNLKAAKALGLTVPVSLRVRADQMIEFCRQVAQSSRDFPS